MIKFFNQKHVNKPKNKRVITMIFEVVPNNRVSTTLQADYKKYLDKISYVVPSLFLCVQRVICIWVYFAKTLAHWKCTNIFLDIIIQGLAHEKAPIFYADCWMKV